ncbi:hypothetical protein [Sphingomonas sp. URHD0057]|uniref:hypothetical protein n=1 Tax=Sphingomonas sp. URHD0057 TaxID=1380389 RepID=UPI00048AF3B7|nr:hypothetical protein [Sphingomonas sp. URHD0057]
MNVCNDCTSIVIIRDDWPTQNRPETQIPDPAAADPEWCRARELAERAAAKRASSLEARRVHQELAAAYARLTQAREA